MNLLIAGSRSFYSEELNENNLYKNYDLGLKTLEEVMEKYDIHNVITGKAKGADTFGEKWGRGQHLNILEYPAEWDKYGKRAGMIRNNEMGKITDVAVIFWDGKSRGTKNMIDIIKKLKKPLVLINFEENEEEEW